MRAKFSHFLITQFNLRNVHRSSPSEDDLWLTWTRNRISLFKEYCLPSVLNQTTKDFLWLIFFDVDTPSEFRPFILELEDHELIKICYCKGNGDFFACYLDDVKTKVRPGIRWIVTTRLDNDDILHKNALEIIQQNFIERDKFMISLSSGYVMDIKRKILSHYFYPMSPFISLIEDAQKNPVGIFAKPHTQWPSLRLFIYKEIYLDFFNQAERQSRFILKHPLWIQVFHGNNVSNSFYRGLPVLKSMDLSDFGLQIRTAKMNFTELTKFWNYVVWKRYFKCWIIKILNK